MERGSFRPIQAIDPAKRVLASQRTAPARPRNEAARPHYPGPGGAMVRCLQPHRPRQCQPRSHPSPADHDVRGRKRPHRRQPCEGREKEPAAGFHALPVPGGDRPPPSGPGRPDRKEPAPAGRHHPSPAAHGSPLIGCRWPAGVPGHRPRSPPHRGGSAPRPAACPRNASGGPGRPGRPPAERTRRRDVLARR